MLSDVSERDLGYLAAIIDGEGNVTYGEFREFDKRNGLERTRKRWSIRIANTDFAILEACKVTLQELGIGYTVHEAKPTRTGKRVSYITVCRFNEVLSLIRIIFPYLKSYKRTTVSRMLEEMPLHRYWNRNSPRRRRKALV